MSDIPCPAVRSDVTCYWKDMWHRLDAMRHQHDLCDVSLLTEDGGLFMAHSPVIAASSDVLCQLLHSPLQLSSYVNGYRTVHVANVSKDVLHVTLNFIYGKTPDSRQDFERLQTGATRFNLPGAYKYCSRKLNEENTGIWNLTQQLTHQQHHHQQQYQQQQQHQQHSQFDSGLSSASSMSTISCNSSSRSELFSASSCSDVASTGGQSSFDSLVYQQNDFEDNDDQFDNSISAAIGGNSSTGFVRDYLSVKVDNTDAEHPLDGRSSENGLVSDLQSLNRPTSCGQAHHIPPEQSASFHNGTRDAFNFEPSNAISSSYNLLSQTSEDSHSTQMTPPQMSLDDMAYVDECPHLRRLTIGSSSITLPALPFNNTDISTARNIANNADWPSTGHRTGHDMKSQQSEPVVKDANPAIDHLEQIVGGKFSTQNVHTNAASDTFNDLSAANTDRGQEFFSTFPFPRVASGCSVADSQLASNFVHTLSTSLASYRLTADSVSTALSYSNEIANSPATSLNNNVFPSSVNNSSLCTQLQPQRFLFDSTSSDTLLSCGSANSVSVTPTPEFNVKPVAFTFSRPASLSQSTLSPTPTVLLGSCILPNPDTCLVSGFGHFERSPKYTHLSGGHVTTMSDVKSSSPTVSTVDVTAAANSLSLSSRSPPSFSPSSAACNQNTAAASVISLDDVSDVLKAHGFVEKSTASPNLSTAALHRQSAAPEAAARPCIDDNDVIVSRSVSATDVSISIPTDKTCSFCFESFKTKRQLFSHIRGTHSSLDGGKVCSQCSATFPTVTELTSHLQMSHGRVVDNQLILALARLNGNACYIAGCNYQNQHADALQRHIYQRHGIGRPSIGCLHCKQAFFSTRVRCYTCVPYTGKCQMNRHVTRSHATKRFTSIYGLAEENSNDSIATLSTETTLSRSPSTGTANHQLPCPDCGVLLASSYKLQIHQLRVHAKGKLFTCQHCSFKSPRKKDVQAHMLSQHGTAPSGVHVYSCKICNYKCIDKNRFEEHEAMHSGIQRYPCTLCANVYTTRRGLRTHLKYHSSDRPHSCSTCGASFKVRSKLADHIKLVHLQKGVKPYVCGYCNHATALRGNCNQHIRKSHPNMPLKVIDQFASQRRSVKDYDYAGISGVGIEEHKDLHAVSWTLSTSSTSSLMLSS